MAEKQEPTIYNNEEIRIVMVGKTGAGKSATGNTILGHKCFESDFTPESVTEQCQKAYGEVDDQRVSVIDTPGLFDNNTDEEKTQANIIQCISYASPGPHIFLIVIKLDRFTEEEKKTVEKIQEMFGEEADKFSMVLFTHGDQLRGKTIEEFLRKSEDLQELVAKCNGQYQVFDNNLKDGPQVTELINKIRKITENNRGNHCKKHESEPTIYNNEEIRIVMVGKTGAGKSAAGNTILGGKRFESRFSFKSVTKLSSKAYGEVDGQKVSVIDTPGLFDTNTDEETSCKNIAQCMSYASPGPHIFLIVIKLGRFTEEEKKTVEEIQKIFGKEADKFSMVLFTYGDQLRGQAMEEMLGEIKDLQELVTKCNGQYHVFDNNLKDGSQTRELLNKIRKITENNRGNHYTTEMFQEVEKAIEEEKQRILKEREEQMRKEQEELERKIKEEHEQQLKKLEEEAKEKERIQKQREEQMRKEQEEKERKIKEEHEKKLKEAEDAKEKERIQREREEEMRKEQEKKEREEMERLQQELKEEKEKAQKQKELREAQQKELEEKTEALKKEQEEKARRAAEESNRWLKKVKIGVGSVAGGAAGAAAAVAAGAAVVVAAPVVIVGAVAAGVAVIVLTD